MDSFIPLSVPSFQGNELKYVSNAVETEWVSTAGSYVNDFEKKIAEYVGSKHSISTVNGTAALHITLLESGISSGDEVIVPTVTFIATINVLRYIGAEPVFMDCTDDLTVDIKKVEKFILNECIWDGEKLINKTSKNRVAAVIPVDIYGNFPDYEHLESISEKYKLKVIQDAAESLGSHCISGKYKNKKAGILAPFGCLSFNGNKIITTGGGGMIITNDDQAASHMKYLTTQAKDDPVYYKHNEVGFNYRMTNLQAALGVAQLEKLDEYVEKKRYIFNRYNEKLSNIKGLSFIKENERTYSNYWFFSLVVNKENFGIDRDQLMAYLQDKKIQTRPIWVLNHKQKPYKNCFAYEIEKAYYYYDKILSLPCSVNLSDDDLGRVIGAVISAKK